MLATIAISAFYWQGVISGNLPPYKSYNTQGEAFEAAGAYQSVHGGTIVPVLGTGSMQPLIPAAKSDPYNTIVAYIVTEKDATYEDLVAGNLVLYVAAFYKGGTVMHVALMRDSNGWIMSGLNNSRSEPQWRVTKKNFVGIAIYVFNIKQ